MTARKKLAILLLCAAVFSGCAGDDSEPAKQVACPKGHGTGTLSTCLAPRQSPAYYVAQAEKYFDTLDTDASRASVPNYSELVARWEWRPWLLLTGYGRDVMIYSDLWVTRLSPSTVPIRKCVAFTKQPFARCRISFKYEGGLCPIYEEFTFNDQGETTFIEAWSDMPALLPMKDQTDEWGEGAGVRRLSTKLPGLGNATGRIDLQASWMREAAERDVDIADFVQRAEHFESSWLKELSRGGGTNEDQLYAEGCGW